MILRSLLKDSAVYGTADLLTKILAFFTFPLIASALSPASFGVLELIGTATALLGVAMGCGLNNAVQRFYWDKSVEAQARPAIVTSGLLAQMIFGVIAVALGLVLAPLAEPYWEKAGTPLGLMVIAAALIGMTFAQWNQYALDVLRLHFAPWRFFSLSLLSRVLAAVAAVIAVVVMGWGIAGLLGVQAIILAIVFPLALYLIRRDLRWRSITRQWLVDLTAYGHPFIYAGLAYWIFGSMDRWMLASLSTIEEVGIYSVAYRFAGVALFVSAAFGQAWSPIAIKIQTDHPEDYRRIYGEILTYLLYAMLIVCGGIALFAGELMSVIMPSEYQSAAMPLAILCLGVVAQTTQQVSAMGISIEKRTSLFARMAWAAAVLNLLLNYLWVPSYGASGAAWATTTSYFALSAGYLYFTQRLHPLVIPWRSLMLLSMLGAVLAITAIYYQNIAPVRLDAIGMKLGLAGVLALFGWFVLPSLKTKSK